MSVAAFISLLTPLLVPHKLIMSEQNGTRPAKPYVTVSIRSILPFKPQETAPDEDGITDVNQHQLNSIEVQFYGENASELADMLALKLRYTSTSYLAENLNIGIGRVNQVLRVPELLNGSQFEERAILEFTAYDMLTGSDNVGVIENVELECFDHMHIVSAPPVVTIPEE